MPTPLSSLRRVRAPAVPLDAGHTAAASVNERPEAPGLDALRAEMRAFYRRPLARLQRALRPPTIVVDTTSPAPRPPGSAPVPPVAAPQRATGARAAQLAVVVFGDDAFHRSSFAYTLTRTVLVNGARVFGDADFAMLKQHVDARWRHETLHAMQRQLVRATFDRELVDGLLGAPGLAVALHRVAVLHTAAQRGWSRRFRRAMLGSADVVRPTAAACPQHVAAAFAGVGALEPTQQRAFAQLCARELAAADLAALRPLDATPLGEAFAASMGRLSRYLAARPEMMAPVTANGRRILLRVARCPELLAAADAQMLHSLLGSETEGDGAHLARLEAHYPETVAALGRSLLAAESARHVEPEEIAHMSVEVFTALPCWALLAALRAQLAGDGQEPSVAAIRPEVFHLPTCQGHLERVIDAVKRAPVGAGRQALLTGAEHALTAVQQPTDNLTCALVAALRGLSASLWAGERTLFSELAALAHRRYQAEQLPGSASTGARAGQDDARAPEPVGASTG